MRALLQQWRNFRKGQALKMASYPNFSSVWIGIKKNLCISKSTVMSVKDYIPEQSDLNIAI